MSFWESVISTHMWEWTWHKLNARSKLFKWFSWNHLENQLQSQHFLLCLYSVKLPKFSALAWNHTAVDFPLTLRRQIRVNPILPFWYDQLFPPKIATVLKHTFWYWARDMGLNDCSTGFPLFLVVMTVWCGTAICELFSSVLPHICIVSGFVLRFPSQVFIGTR